MIVKLAFRYLLLSGAAVLFLGCTQSPYVPIPPNPLPTNPDALESIATGSPLVPIRTPAQLLVTPTIKPAECINLGCPLNRLDTPSAATRMAIPILSETNRLHFNLSGIGKVFRVAISPDGKRLAASSGTGIWIYDVPSQALIWDIRLKIDSDIDIFPIAWSPDGNQLASGFLDGHIDIWDVTKKQKISYMDSDGASVTSLAWSHNGRLLASTNTFGSWDRGVLYVWNISTRERLWEFTLTGASFAWDMDFSPDNTYLAITIDKFPPYGLQIWDLQTGARLNLSSYPSQRSGLNEPQEIIWSVPSPIRIPASGGCAGIFGVRWSPDGKALATVENCFGLLTLWDIQSGQKRYTLDGPNWLAVWSPDGEYLALDDNEFASDYNIQVIRASNGGESRYLTCPIRDAPDLSGTNSADMIWAPGTYEIYAVNKKGDMCIWNPK